MPLRKHPPAREWSAWDKAFWSSLGVLVFTALTVGIYMYLQGITNPLEDHGGALGTLIKVDKVFGAASFVSTIVTAVFRNFR